MRIVFALAAAVFLCAAPAAAQSVLNVAFAQNEAVLSAAERARLDAFATGVATSDGSLVLAGHADASETDAVLLSNRRAGAVRDYLASKGVSTSRISTLAYGSERPALGGGQNRRVDISVGAASGW